MDIRHDQSSGLKRREVLAGLGAVAAFAAFGPAKAAADLPAAPKGFLAASSRLCGVALDDSYRQVGDAVWNAMGGPTDAQLKIVVELTQVFDNEEKLQQVLKSSDLMPKAQALISAWYNGWTQDAAGNNVLISYDEALMWAACSDFTKPPGDCGGPFGYWQDPPAGKEG